MRIHESERKPEIILLTVIAVTLVLAVIFVIVYISFPAKNSGTSDTAATESAAPGTKDPETTEPEDTLILTSGRPADDQPPTAIIQYFSYLDSGQYELLPNVLRSELKIKVSAQLERDKDRDEHLGIFNYKSARVVSLQLVSTYNGSEIWDCTVDVEFHRQGEVEYDGRSRYSVTVVYGRISDVRLQSE